MNKSDNKWIKLIKIFIVVFAIIFVLSIFSSESFSSKLMGAFGISIVFTAFFAPFYFNIQKKKWNINHEKLSKIKPNTNADNILEVYDVQYKGGHLKYASKDLGMTKGTNGALILTKSSLQFNCLGPLHNVKWSINIPLNKILKDELSLQEGNRLSTAQEIGAMTVTGGLIMKRKVNFLTVPYKDEKGIKQKPIFGLAQSKSNSKFVSEFYEQL